MMMQISGLESESFDKYKANKDYFEDVKEFIISDSKASMQQFASYLQAVNNKIKTSPLGKRYLTDGKSLGSVVRDDRSEFNIQTIKRWRQIFTRLSRFSTSKAG